MRIYLPVYTKMGPRVVKTEHGLCAKAPDGKTVWSYDSRRVTGKGIYICGAARSGTVYMVKLLNALGYKISHEAVDRDGSVGYHLVLVKPENCFHQVRHPLKQIASMQAHQSWGFMEDIINVPGRGLFGCMTYWLEWNELIEQFAVWRYNLENLSDVWDEFLDRIGHEKCDIPDIPRNEHSSLTGSYYEKFSHEELSWEDLFQCNEELATKIADKANEYGYKELMQMAFP